MIRSALPFVPLALGLALTSSAAQALDLPPGAEKTAERVVAPATFAQNRFDGAQVPVITQPRDMQVEAWRVVGDSQTNYQLLQSLQNQLITEGFKLVFQCQAVSCGGYDFRFAVGQFAAPELFIDLGRYQYATLRKGDEMVGLLVSHGGADGFVQISRTQNVATPSARPGPATVAGGAGGTPLGDLAAELLGKGHAVLQSVSFATGSADLTPEGAAQLRELAQFLTNHPGARLALVGHTDAVGRLDNNLALSKKRANSVRTHLIATHAIAADRLLADGVGFLAPLTTNLSAEGQELNRRVEAVLLSLE